ncbi:hypothetical protein BKG77_08065 [Mycobacteroides chelonae]|uniref:hypothetical protein n=1 Tax=Mycobacteroides chelonae TaxID=1774 RepID=UPI0008A8CB1C|nr:hypothetical protein [Mycobacteroides chelonae]OHU26298.1 hypothetical protein BKG77_08065 [Mycobacteroides chelonae]
MDPLPSDAPHEVEFFRRHCDDDAAQAAPGLDALLGFPVNVRARLLATLVAVAKAPPKRFAGGGQWEAMHGDMTGYFEARVTSGTPNGKWHYRLFCILDDTAEGKTAALLAVIDGAAKRYQTTLPASRYVTVRELGDEYLKRNPRSLAAAEEITAMMSAN